ncbi:hypothetical protein JCM9140_3308 [Halalkalibacter wakoensis JCM 9140]|uniref:Uncharacterized protein n=1 Tax=Halalkalibacter wakoensis JCM 9140 TaxID=1236970 RepID=W4Q5F4_9BACI|nr:hypothetical protein [Halalkalibacter wakoensis]GAE27185.1 hypothetical protein JCM9140_3308 [Halalkalibacter wakoensis JCM 9140]
MSTKGTTGIQRGQAITFRLPSDTPDHLLKQLQKLKETERRNFSSKIAEFALEGVSNSMAKERETIRIPLPKQLTKEQRNWLRHAHSEALLGAIVFQLLADPVRATSVLASLNSNKFDIEEALYLQEADVMEEVEKLQAVEEEVASSQEELEEEPLHEDAVDDLDDALDNFDWSKALQEHAATKAEEEPEKEESAEDLLGGFLAKMNK